MTKNMGLSIDIATDKNAFVSVKPHSRNLDKIAVQAKRDFAAYAKVEKKEPEQITLTCKTYLCNWQGLAILGNTCPCCGSALERK